VLEVREIAPGLLQVSGTVDLTTVAEFRTKLGDCVDRAVDDGMPVVSIDLHGMECVDAAGLGVLLGAHRRAGRRGSRLRLTRLSPALSRVLLVSRLYRVLDIEYGETTTAGPVPGPRTDVADRRVVSSP
jgi:anti-anti-sigma factor